MNGSGFYLDFCLVGGGGMGEGVSKGRCLK